MIPIGGIILWFGSLLSIPANWQLCNGTNGTPNLRNKFLVGAGDTYAVDETGGVVEHDHEVSGLTHSHGPGDIHDCVGAGPTGVWDSLSNSADATPDATIANASNLPPFHSLAYIQRMS